MSLSLEMKRGFSKDEEEDAPHMKITNLYRWWGLFHIVNEVNSIQMMTAIH